MKPLSVLYFLVTEKSRELNNITVAKFIVSLKKLWQGDDIGTALEKAFETDVM